MTHPTEQLAAYVDGTLAPGERPPVDAHLTTCATCRDEVEATTGARDALRSMATPDTPGDLGARALAEMGRDAAKAGPPGWMRLTPWLAAAAVIGVLALALPQIGTSSDDGPNAASEAGDTAQGPVSPGDVRLEIVEQDFDPDSLATEAAGFAQAERAAQGDAGASPAANSIAAPPEGTFAGKARSNQAQACLREAIPGLPGDLVRLVRASFQGMPAYLGFMVEGPGAGQPADTVTIWAVSATDCSVLALSSHAL